MTAAHPRAALLQDVPTSYDVLGSEIGFVSGHVIDVRTDEVAMPAGGSARRDVVVHPGAVGILPLDEIGRVLLLQQYRHPVRRRLWEPPAGLLDQPDESPWDAARRELFEEAHLQAGRWDVLVDAFTSPGMTDEAVRIFLARDVSPADGPAFAAEHEEADMQQRWVDLDEAVAAVMAGGVHNPLAVMGLLALDHVRRRDFAGLRPAAAPWPEMSSFVGSAGVGGRS